LRVSSYLNRRAFLQAGLLAPLTIGRSASAAPGVWRSFEITCKLEIEDPVGLVRAWVPLPLARSTPFQRDRGHEASGNAARTREARDRASGALMIVAEWPQSDAPPALAVTMRAETTDHRVALDAPGAVTSKPRDLGRYLRPSRLIPVDGIVGETAKRITKGHATDLSRARAIYDWIVENTVRDPEVKGCGLGDIRGMLEMKNLSGKCADLNALFVGLARASGLPARDLYGIRVAPSVTSPSLGRAGGNVTTAQHCRAEIYLDRYGWVPVDPADVRKVMLEERPQAALSDPYIAAVRARLFGSWEGNWIAFNDAHDVALPGSAGKPLPFLMYPQAEAGGTRRDSLDPDRFKYEITARAL
jgi:transglutaminase-like putative cysteine protease